MLSRRSSCSSPGEGVARGEVRRIAACVSGESTGWGLAPRGCLGSPSSLLVPLSTPRTYRSTEGTCPPWAVSRFDCHPGRRSRLAAVDLCRLVCLRLGRADPSAGDLVRFGQRHHCGIAGRLTGLFPRPLLCVLEGVEGADDPIGGRVRFSTQDDGDHRGRRLGPARQTPSYGRAACCAPPTASRWRTHAGPR
jgi:hypothetical protein